MTRIFPPGAAAGTHPGDTIAATVEELAPRGTAFPTTPPLTFRAEVTFFDLWWCFLFLGRVVANESLPPGNWFREDPEDDATAAAAAATTDVAVVLPGPVPAAPAAAGNVAGVGRRGRGSETGEKSFPRSPGWTTGVMNGTCFCPWGVPAVATVAPVPVGYLGVVVAAAACCCCCCWGLCWNWKRNLRWGAEGAVVEYAVVVGVEAVVRGFWSWRMGWMTCGDDACACSGRTACAFPLAPFPLTFGLTCAEVLRWSTGLLCGDVIDDVTPEDESVIVSAVEDDVAAAGPGDDPADMWGGVCCCCCDSEDDEEDDCAGRGGWRRLWDMGLSFLNMEVGLNATSVASS